MRKLAQELDAGAASLYWHVGDKEELLEPAAGPDRRRDAGARARPGELAGAAQGARPRDAPAAVQERRDAAQLSIGRIPTGPNSLPVMERTLAVLAASALPPRVIAYAADMFALYVGAFAYEESIAAAGDAGADGRVPALAAARAVPDAHRPRRAT